MVSASHLRIPHAEKGMAIGLFGGSFNPPHAGHLLVAENALRRLRLDRVWWMVTPGNPLKSTDDLAPLARRIERSERLIEDRRIQVTAFEITHRVRNTAETIELVRRRLSGVRFVWLMGADSLRDFHRWQRWRDILRMVPVAVFDRPGDTLSLLSSTMARAYAHARVDESDSPRLARMSPPAWTFIHGPRSSLSSTTLRLGSDELSRR